MNRLSTLVWNTFRGCAGPVMLPIGCQVLPSQAETSKSDSRSVQQSVRLNTMTVPMLCGTPRSTCHHGLASKLVWVTEPSHQLPSGLPSIASQGPEPLRVLDWLAVVPTARL